ncbi:MAG: transglycosylase SLT domain-containing protein [Candidatus Accumulibacter sp.]|jgi:soluble lytic murein transglycosylase-like protein|nr:transglycosylase SLT domain-containing protein [Accumulibacter sp.]
MLSVENVFKQTLLRRKNVVLYLIQYLVIIGVLFVFGFIFFPSDDPAVAPGEPLQGAAQTLPAATTSLDELAPLSPRMKAALVYIARRYRVSQDALEPLFELLQAVCEEQRMDPLLIVAVMAIESRFNPFAESPMGAQGLMQIIPRFHMDKLPDNAGENPFLNPEINLRVGVRILEEAIRRRGGLVAGLQYYAGSTEPTAGYANRVLAEKQRIEQAFGRQAGTDPAAPSSPPVSSDS